MIFLSASIPNPQRDKKYYDSADVIAIRDAVRALATVILPKSYLVWGGHPAISPLIRYVMTTMDVKVQNHVSLYQSEFFKEFYSPDNDFFENIIITRKRGDKESSLLEMRNRMFSDNKFQVGIFIGGMEGVEEEYEMFKLFHPEAKIFPVASTGAAAKIIYDTMKIKPDQRLQDDYAYMALFRSLFKSFIN